MVLPFLTGGESNLFMILQTIITLVFLVGIFFLPRIMIWQVNRKMKAVMFDLENYRETTEKLFLEKLTDDVTQGMRHKFQSLKNFQMSQPTGIDPAGLVQKLEHVLDSSEDKFDRFIHNHADTEDQEELADLNMAFKGVMGTHQIYKVIRHFKKLINKTGNIQIISLVQMMMPIYKELAESQKDATRAFVDEAPIGDSIGPMVAANLISGDYEEVAEDIIHSEEEVDGQEVHVIKSRGPGARLGKYGDAIDNLAEENDLEAIITVDASAKFEGEETGSVAEGVGVMMGGAGVEKTKIEEAATDHDVPLEGIVIKQSAPEASKPMKKEIYEARKDAADKVKEIVEEFEGPVAVVGVGNTCGVGNTREEVEVEGKLEKYWKEYEEQEEEEVSYMGLMGIMPGGDSDSSALEDAMTSYLWRLPR
ncbi:MAG: DUF1512 family protein [Candidatus Nanohaloarchaea archaeon]